VKENACPFLSNSQLKKKKIYITLCLLMSSRTDVLQIKNKKEDPSGPHLTGRIKMITESVDGKVVGQMFLKFHD
jgi:hypothetical protein